MHGKLRLSYANVASTLALLIALGGGTAYAASQIRSWQIGYHAVTGGKVAFNAITSSKVRNSSLSGRDLRDNSVESRDVRDGSLEARDFAAGQLPQGPKGDPGPAAAALHGTVGADGSLVRGAGVTAVSSAGGGVYTATFDRDVSNCSVVATIADTPAGGTVAARPDGEAARQSITFKTTDLAGAAAQRAFHFAVFC